MLRIYCGFRADANVSRIGYVDVSAGNPKEVIGVSAAPVLDIGLPGTFDDNGVLPASILCHENKLYLYYGGFMLGVKVPYFLFSGLAVSDDAGMTFTRYWQTPIVDRSDEGLFFRTASFVMKEEGIWKMWYIAGSRWLEHNGKQLPQYTMKYMESPDGVTWDRQGHACFHLQGDEHGFGRPWVVRGKAGYKMYYSVRSLSKGYRLGYATSPDGKEWTRRDHALGLEVSDEGWDSQALCYSAVISYGDKKYLFYNGNNYGETGFGYAELCVSEKENINRLCDE